MTLSEFYAAIGGDVSAVLMRMDDCKTQDITFVLKITVENAIITQKGA